jgi:hypothetical protein
MNAAARRHARCIALSLLLAAIPCHAQQPTLTVDAVLARVRENVADFKKSIPGFVSDESVLSQHFDGDKLKDQMKTESSFEMKRIDDKGETDKGNTRETRHIKLVDGKAPKDPQKVSLPWTYSGGYANVIRFSDSVCDDFHLQSAPEKSAPIILLSSSKTAPSGRPSMCSTLVQSTKATIDPETYQVLRIENTTEDLPIDLGFRAHFVDFPSSRNNIMTTSIDYASVELGGKTFWLTKTVTNDFKDKTKPVHMHYEAHYTNYHRFAASSTIVPVEPGAAAN